MMRAGALLTGISAALTLTSILLMAGRASGASEPAPSAPKPPPNPGPPAGFRLMPQSHVTPAMSAWASALLNDKSFQMHEEALRNFDGRNVVARVEWHGWTHRAGELVRGVFRGVTLYEGIE